MKSATDAVLVLLVLTDLMLLGTSRLAALIRLAGLQGIVLGCLGLFVQADDLTLRGVLLAAGSTAIKAGVIPWLLARAMREAGASREPEPFVGYALSLLLGMLLLGGCVWIGSRLSVPGQGAGSLVVPAAFFSMGAGLLLIVSRRTALSQVVGYLVLENGVYTFGISLAREEPLLVEGGVLLDLLVAVFVMGIAIFHIRREFDHIEVDRLSTLRDTGP